MCTFSFSPSDNFPFNASIHIPHIDVDTPSTTNVYKLYDVVGPAQHSHRLCRSGACPALTTASLSRNTLNVNNGI
ncbi:hypothetical protein E5676_scaffold565G00170 [Cucumis melo var. makuwa]|uniref:Uncharacterized protein n=1 Tax=Cucumis melo var. makuwa TaxID=1194695 RepID=A0A5D3BHW3_CUCMM|nr:hypothetical protein E6C27_scaffold578G001010 [Cucumis melo var. makuwa]TYJ98085.1 hypothetical protein E5676_scaffold565G00170 [Cucumis melo var. makuwa]